MAGKSKKLTKYQKKFKIKSGDKVRVISGNYRGQEGTIKVVDREKDRVIVENINLVTKHQKPTQQNPQGGGIVEIEAGIHISNVMLVDPTSGEATRVGRRVGENGKIERYSKKTGEKI